MTESGDSVESRLARLERENLWFKRLASVALLGLGLLVLMGQARPASVPNAIEARRFVVRDGNGQQRAKLGVEPTGFAGLLLYDPSGKVRAAVSVEASGKLPSNSSIKPGMSGCYSLRDPMGFRA